MKNQSIIKSALIAAVFSAFTLIGSAQAQVINVQLTYGDVTSQLNGTPWDSTISPLSYSGTTWNEIGINNPQSGSSLLTSTGVTTGVAFTSGNGNEENVVNNFNPGVPALLQSAVVGDDGITLTFSGLTDGATYNLALVASAGGGGQIGSTFTISGYGSQSTSDTSYTPWTNGDQYVEFTKVAPVSGEIVVTQNIHNSVSYPFDALNGFQLEQVPAIPEPSTYALMGLGALALLVISRRRRTV